ncbi:Mov34-domain-containing protein [Punctularia strigosozonata HHB-11173 SS5]|uniref:Mov34-domain-containing protein n=1 Tax=Punctularia strigosozonata (strain HHB-11173) TaxID=741275 RepID=UPI0004416F3F|nr:Mov34-domain-containing protein [Punctularia strigosozonata HHB-11173 SS5]EIN13648.1 Mov34-domain-containing protein [Punctularia strigosozonata HHB-11173 SS5]
MDTDDLPVVLPSSTTSGLSLALHPLPILNISEHLTRRKLQTDSNSPFVLGALLGTQNGREVEIVNSFELAVEESDADKVDHGFFIIRRDQYKQVFPSLEFIGWYTVAPQPTARHIKFHEQFTAYSSTPLLLILQPSSPSTASTSDVTAQALPFKAYEPTTEIRDRKTRSVFIEASYSVETGEAERIAVDWTAKGGGGETSLESHLQSQRAAVKMLHDRIILLVQYVTDVLAGQEPIDHGTLRSLSALIASLPASENPAFRTEFETEYEDVQLTALLSTLTKSANTLNDFVDKHAVLTSGGRDERGGGSGGPRRRGMSGRGGPMGGSEAWERFH